MGNSEGEKRDDVNRSAGEPVASVHASAKDIWDKADVIGKVFGAVLILFALAGTGFFVNLALQERAAREKVFEIAVTVLQSSNTTSSALREWAINVFEDTVHPPSTVIAQLKTSPLPSSAPKPGAVAYTGACENKTQIVCYFGQNGVASDCRQRPC